MMKHEFEQAMGFAVAPETFDRIEEVYMNCEFFNSKEQLYSFYKQYDMNGIERLYKDVLVKKRLEQIVINLQNGNLKLQEEVAELVRYKNKVDAIIRVATRKEN